MEEFKIPPERFAKVLQACSLTLGWIIAKHGFKADPAKWLAQALEDNGVKSDWTKACLEAKQES